MSFDHFDYGMVCRRREYVHTDVPGLKKWYNPVFTWRNRGILIQFEVDEFQHESEREGDFYSPRNESTYMLKLAEVRGATPSWMTRNNPDYHVISETMVKRDEKI